MQQAAALLKERYAESTEEITNRIRASLRDGEARQKKIREVYELRDRRYGEIDARAEAYLGSLDIALDDAA